jgi:hypothetical protein
MPNLLPFRDYSEHEVINIFACNTVANKGTLVAPVRSWKDNGGLIDKSTNGPLNLSSTGPGQLYTNTVSNNFELVGTVTPVVDYDDIPTAIGLLLKDVRDEDENGKKLVFDSRKAAEMDVVIKDIQAVPILVRGLILVNDIDTTDRGAGGGDPDVGDAAYVGDNGRIGTDGTIVGGTMPKIGRFLSRKDENGYCLVKVDLA